MTKLIKSLVVLFLIHSTVSRADQQIFSLRLSAYPKTTPKCETTAKQVAEQIQSQLPVKVLKAECPQVSIALTWTFGYWINITYTAENKFEAWPSEPLSIHKTYEDCRQGLPKERERFESITGLKVNFEYCSLVYHSNAPAVFHGNPPVPYPIPGASHVKPELRYSTRFYVFGQPKLVERSFQLPDSDTRFSLVQGDIKKLEQEIVEKSKASGIPISSLSFIGKNDSMVLQARVIQSPDKRNDFYKSEYLFSMLNATDTTAQCYEQMAMAKAMFSNFFTSSVVWFCTSYNRSALYYLRINPGPEKFIEISPGANGEPFLNEFPTHEACEQDKSRILDYYKKKIGANLVGALCSFPVKPITQKPPYASIPGSPARMSVYYLQDF